MSINKQTNLNGYIQLCTLELVKTEITYLQNSYGTTMVSADAQITLAGQNESISFFLFALFENVFSLGTLRVQLGIFATKTLNFVIFYIIVSLVLLFVQILANTMLNSYNNAITEFLYYVIKNCSGKPNPHTIFATVI